MLLPFDACNLFLLHRKKLNICVQFALNSFINNDVSVFYDQKLGKKLFKVSVREDEICTCISLLNLTQRPSNSWPEQREKLPRVVKSGVHAELITLKPTNIWEYCR